MKTLPAWLLLLCLGLAEEVEAEARAGDKPSGALGRWDMPPRARP